MKLQIMKTRKRRNVGLAFVELLLVVALVAMVSVGALRAVASQERVNQVFEEEVSNAHSRETDQWRLEELPEGGRAWVRKI